MKLGIDVRPFSYGYTGNSRYLEEVLKRIIPKHKETTFYLYSNKAIHPVFVYFQEFENVKLRIANKTVPGPIYLNFLLPFILKRDGIERFWGTLQMLPWKKLSIPCFVNYHDLNFISAPQTMNTWNYWQHRILSPNTMRNADRIFCLSQNTQNEIVQHFPENRSKCTVIYPGVTKPKVSNQFELPKDYFLTIGTLEPRKNIKRLVEAFQQFRGLFPNNHFKLLVLGRKGWGTEGEDLYQYLHSDQAKKDSIHFFESPEEEFLREAIQKCKVFFFPSLHEGFGLPLLEAMIENKKCVASNIPVFREILETGNDLYVDANDTNAWRDAFVTVSKYKSFTRNPKFNPKIWSWDATAKLLEKEIFQNEMV